MPRAIRKARTQTRATGRFKSGLHDAEGRYRALIEQASDGIFVSDAEGRFLLVNQRGCELLGYSEAELLALIQTRTRGAINQPRLRGRARRSPCKSILKACSNGSSRSTAYQSASTRICALGCREPCSTSKPHRARPDVAVRAEGARYSDIVSAIGARRHL